MEDIEIARRVKLKHINEIAYKLGVDNRNIIPYGEDVAKIIEKPNGKSMGKYVIVTAMNPTKSGIGKTTVAIGLTDALNRLKKNACVVLREPSLGPVFGAKGGATGGGYSQILPMEEINLHFTGDFHAITSANNLLCSYVDNHIFQGNQLKIDPKNIFINRCLDINERELRSIVLSSGRKESFVITPASEVMACFCVAKDLVDLKRRLGNIMVGLDVNGKPVFARDLGAEDSMTILLQHAINPNLVQTIEGSPAFVHGGPFANIAHGCSSVIASKLALNKSDFVVTESGFGADLGLEKFINYKCRISGLKPDCVVMVATIRAIKEQGLDNLLHHINVVRNIYKLPIVVTINKYADDKDEDIRMVIENTPVDVIINNVYIDGGKGAIDLAKTIIEKCDQKSKLEFAYNLSDTIEEKILSVVQKVYGGRSIKLSATAKEKIKLINKLGVNNLPIIMAKTQYSLTSDKTIAGAPKNFGIEIKNIEIKSGAEFLVVICGDVLLMPALGKSPSGLNMRISNSGKISGLR